MDLAAQITDTWQGLQTQFNELFDCANIAEDEISSAMLRNPEQRYLLYGSFLTLRPVASMLPKLYRVHCRELLERIAVGEDYHAPTRAEVLAALQRATWAIPLHNEPAVLYYRLFASLFPEHEELDAIGATVAERYIGETDALYREMVGVMAPKIKRDAPYKRVPDAEEEQQEVEIVAPQQLSLFGAHS